jgi:hypothetical protein
MASMEVVFAMLPHRENGDRLSVVDVENMFVQPDQIIFA